MKRKKTKEDDDRGTSRKNFSSATSTPATGHSMGGTCTLFVVILVSYVIMNLGLVIAFALMTGMLQSSAVALTNLLSSAFLLLLLRLRFSTPCVLFLWTAHLYLFASRLTVCAPSLGVDKWFLVLPMQAFFITGVKGGSFTLFVGTLLHTLLPFWSDLLRDSCHCSHFPEEYLPAVRIIATSQFAIYVGISCVGYELSRSSALRQLQRALAEKEASNEQLVQVSKAKERFIANTSHELRTPLHGIIAMTSQLLEDNLVHPNHAREAMALILDCAQHLNRLISDMFSFQTLSCTKPDLSNAAFSLSHEIERAWNQCVGAALRKGVRTICSIHLEHERRWGNAQSVNQILQCLLSNAVKFTPVGGSVELIAREIEPRVGKSGDSGSDPSPPLEMVELQVIDTGIGINTDNLAHLFSGFSQLDDSLRREYGGNGLGLAISQRLVEAMGGSLACSSEPNRGSTFTIVLPLPCASDIDHSAHVRGNVQAAERPQGQLDLMTETVCSECAVESISRDGDESSPVLGVTPLLATSSASTMHNGQQEGDGHDEREQVDDEDKRSGRLSKPWVLLVEDNHVNQKVGMRMLESLGYNVDIAGNGLEALHAVTRALAFEAQAGDDLTDADEGHSYALILMDCQMPVMDGFEATRKIRKLEGQRADRGGRRGHIPIAAVTASPTPIYENECYACGMDDFVAKPLNRSTMKNMLDKWTRADGRTIAATRRGGGGDVEDAEGRGPTVPALPKWP